tara:strand:+ start:268 stop:450 length:183 start_codon:yes stop_codon:yes gene_type:complete
MAKYKITYSWTHYPPDSIGSNIHTFITEAEDSIQAFDILQEEEPYQIDWESAEIEELEEA